MQSVSELWTGQFGNDYTARNTSATLGARRKVWEMILPSDCESVLEVGANTGLNLEAIGQFNPSDLYACEPNQFARAELETILPSHHVTADYADKISFPDKVADLVFTCGVLIHVPPDKILASMKEIHRCSKRWIVCAEYFAPEERELPYRGQRNALWLRDYGSLWLDNFPDLTCIATFFAWKRMTGLDNLTFWLFEKGRRRH
jgi:pseudaminic acid biosynthesis-associated methylase